jgi:hypothetical protein
MRSRQYTQDMLANASLPKTSILEATRVNVYAPDRFTVLLQEMFSTKSLAAAGKRHVDERTVCRRE